MQCLRKWNPSTQFNTSLGVYCMPSTEKLSVTSVASSPDIFFLIFPQSCFLVHILLMCLSWPVTAADPTGSQSFTGAECVHLCLGIMYYSPGTQHLNPLLPFLSSSTLPLPLLPRQSILPRKQPQQKSLLIHYHFIVRTVLCKTIGKHKC